MTQSRSFLLPALPPEPGRRPRSDGWGQRLTLWTAGLAIAGLLAVGFAGHAIDEDQNAPWWPLIAALVGQSIGVVGIWAREGWLFVREGRHWAGAALVLIGPVVAAAAAGWSWIMTVWALYALS